LVTALAYFFGWARTSSLANFFGLDYSTLGFSTQDYLLRSVDAAFVPLGAILLTCLGLFVAHGAVVRLVDGGDHDDTLRRASQALVVGGAVVLAAGIIGVFKPLGLYYLLPPLLPGAGVALLGYGLHLGRRLRDGPARRHGPARIPTVLAAMIVLLSFFWGAFTYASALGRGRAESLLSELRTRPGVVVYAKEPLDIRAAGVSETRVEATGSPYLFRYAGLRLLVRSGGKYFLVPHCWTRRGGTAIVLPDTDALRFEFVVGPNDAPCQPS